MPKKHWLRFHLSTAIVVMLVAAALLWVNMQPPKLVSAVNYDHPQDKAVFDILTSGWPYCSKVHVHLRTSSANTPTEAFESYMINPHYGVGNRVIVINLLSAMLILVLTAAGCELILRLMLSPVSSMVSD